MASLMTRTDSRENRSLALRHADDFKFKSRVGVRIRELSVLRRGLLMAELTLVSGLQADQLEAAAGRLGFSGHVAFGGPGIRASWFWNDRDSVLVFRGDDPGGWSKIRSRVEAPAVPADTAGRVNREIRTCSESLWPEIESALEKDRRPLWFSGHSLGAAVATVVAGKCLLSYIRSEPEELHTFGSPRVGCRQFVGYAPLTHFRWVNVGDRVPRHPSVLGGYRHGGRELILDHVGRVRELRGWNRFLFGLKGQFAEVMAFRSDRLPEHSPLDYAENLYEAIRLEDSGRSFGL